MWLAQRRGFGNLVVLRVRGRRSGIERQTPLGLLTVAERRYLGHPSGDTGWTLNVREAEEAVISSAQIGRVHVRAILLERGDERDAVVRASFRQHPFPGNAMYRLAGSHVAATGVFFRLEVRSDQQSGRAARTPVPRVRRPSARGGSRHPWPTTRAQR